MRRPPPKRKNEIANVIRWSKTRMGIFKECRRKYYLRYYLHWGGWEDQAPEISRLAYRLGKMVTMPMLVGSSVHEVLAAHLRALRNGQYRSLNSELAVKKMRRVWMDAKRELWRASPKKYPPLFEIYYDQIPPQERLLGYADKARRTVQTCRQLPLYRQLKALDRSGFLWVDPAGGAFNQRVVFEVGPYQAISIPDLVFREEGIVYLIDWKTGKRNDADRIQMEAGAIWARFQPGMKERPVRALLVYLETGEVVDFEITEEDRQSASEKISQDMEAMLGLLEDPEANLPLPMEAFPPRENRNYCRHCEFQELCFNYFQPAGNN